MWGRKHLRLRSVPSVLWGRESRCREGRSTKTLGRVLTAPARLPSPLRYGHEWFRGFNFAALRKQTMRPPFTPTLGGPDDTRYFIDCGERLPSWGEIRASLCVRFCASAVGLTSLAGGTADDVVGSGYGRYKSVGNFTDF